MHEAFVTRDIAGQTLSSFGTRPTSKRDGVAREANWQSCSGGLPRRELWLRVERLLEDKRWFGFSPTLSFDLWAIKIHALYCRRT